jgi:hypothetical protein
MTADDIHARLHKHMHRRAFAHLPRSAPAEPPPKPQARGRFLMLHDFWIGNACFAAGETVDGALLPWPLPWTGLRALDQAALHSLCASVTHELWHQLHYTQGLRLPDPHFPIELTRTEP